MSTSEPAPETEPEPAQSIAPEEPVKTAFWARPFHWLFEEDFWKDVTTRTVAGGTVVGIGYAYGVAAGTIPAPTNKIIVVVVLVVPVAFFVSRSLTMVIFRRLLVPFRPQIKDPHWWDMAPSGDFSKAGLLCLLAFATPIAATVGPTFLVFRIIP